MDYCQMIINLIKFIYNGLPLTYAETIMRICEKYLPAYCLHGVNSEQKLRNEFISKFLCPMGGFGRRVLIVRTANPQRGLTKLRILI